MDSQQTCGSPGTCHRGTFSASRTLAGEADRNRHLKSKHKNSSLWWQNEVLEQEEEGSHHLAESSGMASQQRMEWSQILKDGKVPKSQRRFWGSVCTQGKVGVAGGWEGWAGGGQLSSYQWISSGWKCPGSGVQGGAKESRVSPGCQGFQASPPVTQYPSLCGRDNGVEGGAGWGVLPEHSVPLRRKIFKRNTLES